MELLTYSTSKKSWILLYLTTNKKKDRCGHGLIVQDTNTLVGNLGEKYNYPVP